MERDPSDLHQHRGQVHERDSDREANQHGRGADRGSGSASVSRQQRADLDDHLRDDGERQS